MLNVAKLFVKEMYGLVNYELVIMFIDKIKVTNFINKIKVTKSLPLNVQSSP